MASGILISNSCHLCNGHIKEYQPSDLHVQYAVCLQVIDCWWARYDIKVGGGLFPLLYLSPECLPTWICAHSDVPLGLVVVSWGEVRREKRHVCWRTL